MSSTVVCSIRGSSDGVDIVKEVEISSEGEGGYLANLSSQLRQLQNDVNATLTELVDKEKLRAQGTNPRRGIKPFTFINVPDQVQYADPGTRKFNSRS